MLHTPNVTSAATTKNVQTTSGLVITPNAADAGIVQSFQITNIVGGTLFLNDGTTAISNGDFISVASGAAGLKFTPAANSGAQGTFKVQETSTNDASGLGGTPATATINVQVPTGPPNVANTTTQENTQTTSGLTISPKTADVALVSYFQITNISGGTLFLHDGVTSVAEGGFVSIAQGAAGLRFTPTNGSLASGNFKVQESSTNDATGLAGAVATATITIIRPPISWTGNGDGTSWSDPANWLGNSVPIATDDVLINVASNQPVIFDASAGNKTVHSLSLGPARAYPYQVVLYRLQTYRPTGARLFWLAAH